MSLNENDFGEKGPWWLLVNLLALDAPCVAVVWQRALAQSFELEISWNITLALALAVWAIYLADRALDAKAGHLRTHRHRFAHRHGKLLLTLGFHSAVGALALGLRTPIARGGWLLAGYVLAYAALVHWPKRGFLILPRIKEGFVALGFSLGVFLPALLWLHPYLWLAPIGMFFLLCWLNCVLIEAWETGEKSGIWSVALGTGLVLIAPFLPVGLALSSLASLALLLSFHFLLRKNKALVRVLADAALLTPLALSFQ